TRRSSDLRCLALDKGIGRAKFWGILPVERPETDRMTRTQSYRISRFAALLLGVAMALCASTLSRAANAGDKVDFNRQIKPLLSDRCYKCHGPDEQARKAKLRLDLKDGAFKKLEDGMSVIKPADLAKSEVYRR